MCPLHFLHRPLCLHKTHAEDQDTSRCSDVQFHTSSATCCRHALCLLFQKLSAAITASGLAHISISSNPLRVVLGMRLCLLEARGEQICSWHWEVIIDVGPFAGAQLQVTALSFFALHPFPAPGGITNSLVVIL